MMDEQRRKFEEKVRGIGRAGLPGEWRAEILTAAMEEERSSAVWWVPPRWLGAGLAACWATIGILSLSTPDTTAPGGRLMVNDLPEEQLAERRVLLADLWETEWEGDR